MNESLDRRSGYVRRAEQRIPETFLTRFNFEAYKALKMVGLKLEGNFNELSIDNKRLVERMMPFVIDQGCMGRLDGLNPLPEEFIKADEKLYYDNRPLDPVAVMSSAVMPFLVKNKSLVFGSVDGEGIYSHNEVSNLEADRAIRRMLVHLRNGGLFIYGPNENNGNAIVRFKGDHFVVAWNKLWGEKTDDRLKKIIDQEIERLKIENIEGNNIGKLASFRINERGELLLDSVRMHREDSEISEETVQSFKFEGSLKVRQKRIVETHPEQESLIQMIASRSEEEQEALTGILEESLFDPRLQGVVDKYNKLFKARGVRIQAFKEISDLQNHIIAEQSGFAKLDLASSLKSINSEMGFGEEAGDQFLMSLFDQMVKRLGDNLPRLEKVNVVRRWGDFYFVDDRENCDNIARQLLMMFQETPYAIIKKNKKGSKEKYAVSFVEKPPIEIDDSVYVLPLMPIVGLDENVRLHKIEPGTESITADSMRFANEIMFSARMKAVDEEVRNLRPRLIGERLESMDAVDIEFVLFKMFNPTDVKRGLVRLRKLLNAGDEDIKIMITLKEKIIDKVGEHAGSSARINVLREMIAREQELIKKETVGISGLEDRIKAMERFKESGNSYVNLYLNTMFDLINKIVSRQPLIVNHNGIRTRTITDVMNEQEEIQTILRRIGNYL